jgi:hypothetical protein
LSGYYIINGCEAARARIDHLAQIVLNIGAPKGGKGETAGLQLLLPPPKAKLKEKHTFCRYDDIIGFT